MRGFSRGAISAYMVGAELSQKLNIPISILALDPTPGNTTLSSKFSSSVYQKTAQLDLSRLYSILTILGNYHTKIGFQQMVPDDLLSNKNSNVLSISKENHTSNTQDDIIKKILSFMIFMFLPLTDNQKIGAFSSNKFWEEWSKSPFFSSCFFTKNPVFPIFYKNHQTDYYALDSTTQLSDNLQHFEQIQKQIYSKDFQYKKIDEIASNLRQELVNYCETGFFSIHFHHHKEKAQKIIHLVDQVKNEYKLRTLLHTLIKNQLTEVVNKANPNGTYANILWISLFNINSTLNHEYKKSHSF